MPKVSGGTARRHNRTEARYLIRFPDPERVCTFHVERLNLDVRMKCRRFTRLTNDFSRKLRNHRAAVALTLAQFNFVSRIIEPDLEGGGPAGGNLRSVSHSCAAQKQPASDGSILSAQDVEIPSWRTIVLT
ncbi:MAG: hypothetical protein ACOC5M_03445 [Chloroflexota bacterium]